MREHRLYQADWLYRFYGFSVDEIVSAAPGGMFDPAIDPKLAWALANRALFPVDINRAPKEMLLRVPGIGATSVKRILATRRYKALRLDDLQRLKVSLKAAQPFVTALDWQPGRLLDEERLKERLKPAPQQLSLLLPEAA